MSVSSPKFVIPHIPKTGGDAIKQIFASLNLPEVAMAPINGDKHRPIFPCQDQDLILSFRRLPNRELSLYFHAQNYWKQERAKERYKYDTATENILHLSTSEAELTRYLKSGEFRPKYFIRSESLRSDLESVLSHYYELNASQKTIIALQPTKRPMQYNKDIWDYFTEEDVKRLYRRSPLWAEMERAAYGDLLVQL